MTSRDSASHITSAKNVRIKAWRRLLDPQGRQEAGAFLIEGPHLVAEALAVRLDDVQVLLVEEGKPVPTHAPETEVCTLSPKAMAALCDVQQPQGVAAICRMRPAPLEPAPGRFLLLDDVRDPGNLGTLIRTADAAGLDAVVVGETCVDPYNPKALRASQGSIFHLPVVQGELASWIAGLRACGVPVYGTVVRGGLPYHAISPQRHFALLLGNEAHGVSARLLVETDANVTIPLPGHAESLSVAVAGGILLFHLVR